MLHHGTKDPSEPISDLLDGDEKLAPLSGSFTQWANASRM